MCALKVFPDRSSLDHIKEEIRLIKVLTSRYEYYSDTIRHASPSKDKVCENLTDYVADPLDVKFRGIPDKITDAFYERWYPYGLVSVLWVLRVWDDCVADYHGVFARFDNEQGAMLFYLVEYGGEEKDKHA